MSKRETNPDTVLAALKRRGFSADIRGMLFGGRRYARHDRFTVTIWEPRGGPRHWTGRGSTLMLAVSRAQALMGEPV